MGMSWKVLLLIIGVATLTLRALLDSGFATTTLVYIAVPFALSLILAFFTRTSEKRSWKMRYLNHMRLSTIVFLATSAFLFEGFICVAMFMPILAIPTMGESWHCNHHAFPRSAAHGLYPGQIDLGFQFIKVLERVGLAWDIKLPANLPPRPGISPVTQRALSIAAPGQSALSKPLEAGKRGI